MTGLNNVILQYRELCAYCDSFFSRVHSLFASDMACVRGCAFCCTLGSVCAIEAYSIARFLQQQDIHESSGRESSGENICPFLSGSDCAVYPVRPVICRTHGIPVFIPGERGPSCCPRNFTLRDVGSLGPENVCNIERVTTNLIRLNIAFCMISGNRVDSGRRYSMTSIRNRALPADIMPQAVES